MAESFRARARRVVVGRVAGSPAVARALEAVGAHTLADRADLRRARGEVVAIRLPPAPSAWRSTRVKALRQGGRDQCVEAFHQGGWWGYERPLPDVLLATVRSCPGLVLDVGANTGVYALIAASVRGSRVVAFEAYAPVAQMLADNLALDPSARVSVVRAAVGDEDGEVELFVPPSTGPVETSASLEHDFKEGARPTRVPALRLDTWWAQAGRPPVRVVKVDVEGAEHRVLAGARALLSDARPVVFCELLPGARFDQVQEVLTDAGYRDVRLSATEAVVGDSLRFHELAWNHAFVPEEVLEPFLDRLPPLGLLVTRLPPVSP